MKPDIRWQLLLAAVGLAVVMALMSFQVQSAALCTTSVPASGGALVEGLVGRPLTINPLLSDGYPVDRELVNLVFDGLLALDEHGELVPGLAEAWSMSDDGLTVEVRLRPGATWHDGRPVTADDVLFTFGLLQSEAFPAAPALKALWQTVTMDAVDSETVRFTLSEPYAPFLYALTRGLLPAHLLGDLPPAEIAGAAFNRSPVGTGPFMVEAGQDWERSGRLGLTPNPAAWRGGTQLASLEYRFYPDEAALLSAYAGGELQAASGLSAAAFDQLSAREDTRLFTSVAPRYTSLVFNQSDSGAPALRQKDVRQALAFALDRENLVDTALNGQGVVFEGPYRPGSWASNPGLLTSYRYQPETATALLDGAGWVMPEGGQTRQREDAPLTVRVLALDTAQNRRLVEAILSAWQAVGVTGQATYIAELAAYRQALAERAFDIALVDVAPPGDPDLYDFWSQEAIVQGQNYGGWNNRRASEALEAGRRLTNKAERLAQYESFLRQFDADLPALTLFQPVDVYALRDSVQRADVGRLDQPRDRYATFADWFTLYRHVAVNCPPSG